MVELERFIRDVPDFPKKGIIFKDITPLLADPEAKQIQDDLEKQLQRIRKLEQEMKPIEVADKRELSRLQELAARNPGLKDLLRAQADYFEMMNKVNNTILMALAPSDEEKGDDQSAGVSSS